MIIEIFKKNWFGILVSAVLLTLCTLQFRGCQAEKLGYSPEYVSQLLKSRDSVVAIAQDAQRRLDILIQEKDSIIARGVITKTEYITKTRIEKVRVIERIVGPVKDSAGYVYLNSAQVDSVNYIAMERDLCESLLDNCSKRNTELTFSVKNYSIATSKGDKLILDFKHEIKTINNSRTKDKKRIKRNRNIAIGATAIALLEGLIITLKQ
jgi:hypothetical protein